MINSPQILHFITTLFYSRQDVFAVHWQKGEKQGYMPAYQYDPYRYQMHKRAGGSFKDYNDKTYRLLTENEIIKHLNGEQLIGIYPLLKDNTSWFIAADFDENNWQEEALEMIRTCEDYHIPAYLERSRSGNGGHVWLFFEQAYPAVKSRKVVGFLLEKSGIVSAFDKNSSFDRLFPNQDYLSGKGLGNLIALPFYKPALEKGNSCFVDIETVDLKPFSNQSEFLSSVKRVKIEVLDELFSSIHQEKQSFINNYSNQLQIRLGNDIRMNRAGISIKLINYIKEELNVVNSEFFIKNHLKKNTWNTKRYFNFVEEMDNEVIIPRGFIGNLLRYCKQENIPYQFVDERKKLNTVTFFSSIALLPHQTIAMNAVKQKEFGIIVMPPGAGKTVIGLKILEEKQQPALILVHRKQLLEQWIERIETFLGISKKEIGSIGQGKYTTGAKVTVATIQSLGKYMEKNPASDIVNAFGLIIFDECHHIPAESYRNTLSKFNSYYQYGLTATPFRKNSDTKVIFNFIGEQIVEIKPQDITTYKNPIITIRKTQLDVPYNAKTDEFETLSKILIHDSERNKLILKDIRAELEKEKRVIVLTERKEHIETLSQFLKHSHEIVTLSGDDSEKSRALKWQQIENGNYQILITTGQFFGEGTDIRNASSLVLAYPFSFKGKLIQYIGRIQRTDYTPMIYDYHDYKIDYLNKLFLKRNKHYRFFDKQASLFDELETRIPKASTTFEKTVKVPIDTLDFRYGAVAFTTKIPILDKEIEFEIENDMFFPEFDVLKPYFAKSLKSKSIEVAVFAEVENGELVAQSAHSKAIEKINQEFIEGVKFSFVQRNINRKNPVDPTKNILTVNELQENTSLYNSGEDLLNDFLKDQQAKHYRSLRYLASRHESTVLKIRFVLRPFAFLFLLSGNKQYHIIMETYNTEEATYIWHIEKNLLALKSALIAIDQDLSIIKSKGRQYFLEHEPANFSKIVHDYSNDRKGFVCWREMLEGEVR